MFIMCHLEEELKQFPIKIFRPLHLTLKQVQTNPDPQINTL